MTENIELRVVVTTDGHWGEDDPQEGDSRYPDDEPTGKTYQETHDDTRSLIEDVHNERAVDVYIDNGDIVHDDETLHPDKIDNYHDLLPSEIDWYPSFGNHDWATNDEWNTYYGHDKSISFSKQTQSGHEVGFIIAETGEARDSAHGSPEGDADAEWIKNQIDDLEAQGVDIILGIQHIPPTDELSHGNDTPEVREQWERDIVKAVFTGHGHDENTMHFEGGQRYFQSELNGNSRVYVHRGIRVFDINEKAFEEDADFSEAFTIDDFEHNDLQGVWSQEWDREEPFGSSQIQGTTVYEGDYALEMELESSPLDKLYVDGTEDEIEGTPQQGDTFEGYVRLAGSDMRAYIWYLMTDETRDSEDGYEFVYESVNDQVRVRRYDGGSQTTLDSNAITPVTNDWVRVEVEITEDGNHNVVVEELDGTEIGSLSFTDTTYNGDMFGLASNHNVSGSAYFDEFIVPAVIQIVDDFERSSLDHYTGATGNYEISSTRSFNGDNSLHLLDGWDRIASTSGLDNYPEKGDTVWSRMYLESGSNSWGSNDTPHGDIICIAAVDIDNHYRVSVTSDDDELKLTRRENGGNNELDTATIGENLFDQWIEAEVDWADDDTISVTLYDGNENEVASVSAVDSTFADESGIAFNGNEGDGEVYWDYVTIE